MHLFYSKLREPRSCAFTLLEVILAVTIATGILIAVLLFYRQTANLRVQLVQETDRLTAIRLLLDRIAADLRTAHSDYEIERGVKGDTSSLEFVRIDLPPASAWAKTEVGRAIAVQSDLKLVSYRASTSMEGTNLVVSGLVRTEQPLLQPRTVTQASRKASVSEQGSPPQKEPEPITDAVKYIRFRYWTGSFWSETWDDTELPQGVEISLGLEAASESTLPGEYSFEVFRRVVYLPSHGLSRWTSSTSESSTESLPEPGGMP